MKDQNFFHKLFQDFLILTKFYPPESLKLDKKQYEIVSAALGKKDMKKSKELRSLLLGDIPDDPGKHLVKAHPVSENKLPVSVLNALNM